ncbi:hypothetical protein N7478_006725 [Penicillium angulare]|uniref:uncharacterized protein n=1 Tax=Penicillium angulare TaxID=116970 RepID=UPI00253F9886|nr:uncharacterized protein N7478_006725 [Penicillium angulare]KAJ5281353.1 hypothetical protein N7478_006725 [Penicillium angulare]
MDRSVSPESSDSDGLRVSISLAPPRLNKTAETTSLDFDGRLTEPLLLKEDLKNGCGGQLWPAGMVLANYLLDRHPEDLANKSIVELGSGVGLVGLAVARGCKTKGPLYITDQQPMFDLMKDNIQLNDLDTAVSASILNWGEPIPKQIPSKPDIILAADCVYFEPAFPLLVSTLQDLLGPNSVCYFCYKKRRRADARFMKMAKKAFDMVEIKDDPNAPSYDRENIFLLEIRLKSSKKL